jgi:signal transduction histidine kinase
MPPLERLTFAAGDIAASQRSRDMAIESGMALARIISLDRALPEVAQQLRRAIPCDAVAIALAGDDSATLTLVHHAGFSDGADTTQARLAPCWREALTTGQVVMRSTGEGSEITVPMVGGEGVRGAITVAVDAPVGSKEVHEPLGVLTTIASHAALAVERARLVQRAGQRKRLDAIGEVSAGVAHELRNPLFGISSAAQLLRFRVKDDPVVEKNVGRILREVERLNSMVSALLEYGRLSPITLEPGDPDLVWDEVLENQRGLLESRAILLERSRAKPSATCAIDAKQFAQVLINLLANATDAAPEGSDLSLQSSVLSTGMWRCRLHNGGSPIAADVLPHVFEIFFSTKPGGTGIGLPLCQRIIEEHGGTITIESAPEHGTSATILLPLLDG